MKNKSILIILLVVAVLLGIKFIFLSPKAKNKGGGNFSKGGPVKVTAYITQPTILENKIFATGTIKAYEEAALIPEVSGKLQKINFTEGSPVSKGTLLAKIVDSDLQAQLVKLNTQLQLAEDKESRLKQLLNIQGVSQEDYDAAINTIKVIKADVAFVQSQIAKTEIRAPFDGEIGLRLVSEGSFVNTNTVLTTMQQINLLKIDFMVPEKYASIIKKGDLIKFNVENVRDTFAAKVEAIEPKIDPTTRNITMRAVVNNSKMNLFAGSFARVELIASRKHDALLIPTEAIIPELKGKKVFVNRKGKATPIKIVTNTRNDKMIEVIEGLKVGDTVITTGLMNLKPDNDLIITNFKK